MWKTVSAYFLWSCLFLYSVSGAPPTCPISISQTVISSESVGYVISDLKTECTDPDGDTLTFVINNGNTGGLFNIVDGELRIAQSIPASMTYRFDLVIDVTDATPVTIKLPMTLSINYTDNTNDPVITMPTSVSISEDTWIGEGITRCTLSDLDEPKGTLGGQVRAELDRPFGAFAKKFTLDSLSCELFVHTRLDYEKIKQYKVVIKAKDLDPFYPRTATATLTVNVQDVNDNPPSCEKYSEVIPVISSISVTTEITKINCSDADTVGGPLSYSLDATNSVEVQNLFEVESLTGTVKVKSTITSPTTRYYDILIKVEDGVFTVFNLVRVVVTDITGPFIPIPFNLNTLHAGIPDQFSPVDTTGRTSLTSSGTASIPYCELNAVTLVIMETQATGVDLYDFKCTDPDGDGLIYNIIKGDTYNSFEIVNGQLRLRKKINGDFTAKLSLHVEVTDNSPSRLKTDVAVGVYIRNVNDNKPKIKDLPEVIQVSEGESIGSIINSCSINDKDRQQGTTLGGQNRVGWTNSGDANTQSFHLDSVTCDLYVSSALDYESVQSYPLELSAWDLDPSSPRSASQTFTVIVLDVNDNPPVCPASYDVSLPEDESVGNIVATVACTDVDSGDNAKVYFKLDASNTEAVKGGFIVGATSGDVILEADLDFETDQSHDVIVVAYDGGTPSLSATSTVRVTVTDVLNDNNPVNNSIPSYNAEPTVNVQLSPSPTPRYSFRCNFPLDTQPLQYLVIWTIDGKDLYTSPRATTDVPTNTMLSEAQLATVGVTKAGFDISCRFRASFTATSPLSAESTPSNTSFIGIKVLTPTVTLKQGEEGVVQVQTTVPIGCSTASCNYPLYTYLQQRGYDCSATEGASPCGVSIPTNDPTGTIYDVPVKGGVTFQYGRGISSSTLKLRALIYPDHPLWANYALEDVTVNIEQNTALIEGSKCSAFVDPRIVTFDRGLLDLQDVDTYTLYSHDPTKTEVQIKTYKCDIVTDAHCVCGVALRSGRTVYRLDDCQQPFPLISYTLCDDADPNLLKVEMLEKFYQVYLPTGTRVKIFLRPNNMNIFVYPSVMDIGQSKGLCGNLTGDSTDDLVLRDGSQSSERVSRAKFEVTPTFFASWAVAPADDLFNINNYGSLEAFPGGSFVYNPDAYSCVAMGSPFVQASGTVSTDACTIFTDINRSQTDATSAGYRVVEKKDCGAGNRKKRSVPSVMEPVKAIEEEILIRERRDLTWRNGWTNETAREFCNQLFNESSMVSLCKDLSLVDVTSALVACYQDIELSGSANYSLDTMSSIRSQCIHEISANDTFKIPDIPGQPPVYDTILAVACPGECSKLGICVDGKCDCDEGYGGIDCSVDIKDNPLLVFLANGGYCDLSIQSCTEISAFGKTYVDGPDMGCKTTYFELHDGNEMVYLDDQSHKPFLESISEAVVIVPTLPVQTKPNGKVIAYGYRISLSNDGVAYSEPNYLAIFNGECQTCTIHKTGVTCSLKPGYCVSGGVCYQDGAPYKDNDCYYCKADDMSHDWVLKDDDICSPPADAMAWIAGPIIGVILSLFITIAIIFIIKRKNKISASQTELNPGPKKIRKHSKTPIE